MLACARHAPAGTPNCLDLKINWRLGTWFFPSKKKKKIYIKQGGHVWLEKISFPLFLCFDPFPDQYQGCKFLPFSEKFRVKVAKFWTF